MEPDQAVGGTYRTTATHQGDRAARANAPDRSC